MNGVVAVPVVEGKVFAHFGKATTFAIYTIEDNQVVSSVTEEAGVRDHADMALWLVFHGVNAVLCGDIGPGAMGALTGAGIVTLAGVAGAADTVVAQLIAGDLTTVSTATCAGHHGGGCGESCSHGGGCGHHGGGCGSRCCGH